VIITRSRNGSDDIKPLGKDNLWFLIETNYDNWKKPPIFDDRLTPCIKCMQTKGKNQVTYESLFNVFSSRPMLNKVKHKNVLLFDNGRFVLVDCIYGFDGTSNWSIGILFSIVS
jgi:hypothetical protein